MMVVNELFLGQYQSGSQRLPDWDYAAPGRYSVTLCTKERNPYFGEIVDGEMKRNEMGEVAHNYWIEIPSHHSNVSIDEFIIMPDHIHGIFLLTNNEDVVETLHATSLRKEINQNSGYYSEISPKEGSLSTIIRSYKSAVTREIHKHLSPSFGWQSRYYDHILRTETDLNNLREYIHLNPERTLAHA